MNGGQRPNKSELILGRNRNLAIKRSDLVRRGLELIDEGKTGQEEALIAHEKETFPAKLHRVTNEAMEALINEGIPYSQGIYSLLGDFEFHYLQWENTKKPNMFSSIQRAKDFFQLDVKHHSEMPGLNYEIGKRLFHYWAGTFHKEEYKKLMDQVGEIEGIAWKPEKIVSELKKLLKEIQ